MTLPQGIVDKIRQSAAFKYTLSSEEGERIGYQAGATEWAEKAHDLANTLEIISKIHTSVSGAYTMKDLALKALAKYKEVGNG